MWEEQNGNNIFKIFKKEPKPEKKKPDLRLGDPDEVLTVSRGLLNENGRPGKSTPWSDDDNNAVGVLFLLHRNGGFFEKGRIKRRDIDRMKPGGEEIFLQHRNLIDSYFLELYGEPYIDGHFPEVCETYYKFAEIIDRRRFAQKSSVHNKPHEKRVLLLCLFLARELGLSDADAEALGYAAAYHDTGRLNDFAEEAHGEAGAERYKRSEKDKFDPAVYFVIKYHSIKDEKALKALAEDKELLKDEARVKRLYAVFKDADALDRVRLGIDAIDVYYLRHEKSLQFILVAQRLLERIYS